MADEQLDARGLKCPLPVLKARKALKGLAGGQTLEILATDPGSVADFEAFCAVGGHQLLEQTRERAFQPSGVDAVWDTLHARKKEPK